MIIKVTIGSKKSDNGSISEHEEYIELETFEAFTKEFLLRELVMTRDIWIERSKSDSFSCSAFEKLFNGILEENTRVINLVKDWPDANSDKKLQFHGDKIYCFSESGNYHSFEWVEIQLIIPRFCYKPAYVGERK
jgi:hypothetical protein